jgi:hypothetical protein
MASSVAGRWFMRIKTWTILAALVSLIAGCEGKKEISCSSICSHYAACHNGEACEGECPFIREQVRDEYWDKAAECVLDLQCDTRVDDECHEPLLDDLTILPCLAEYAQRDCEILLQCGDSLYGSVEACVSDRRRDLRHLKCSALEEAMDAGFGMPCESGEDWLAIFDCVNSLTHGVEYIVRPYLGEVRIYDAYPTGMCERIRNPSTRARKLR